MSVFINPYTDFGFKKLSFSISEFSKLTLAQQFEYDQSRLQYIGAKEIANTAKEDGFAEGVALAEARAEQEKERMMLEMKADGMTIEQIAKFSKKTIEEVTQILSKQDE